MPSTNSIPRRIWHLVHTQSLGQWWDQHSLHEDHHPSLHLCYYLGNTWLWWSIFDTFKGHTGSKMESWRITSSQYTHSKQLHWCTSTTESLCKHNMEQEVSFDQAVACIHIHIYRHFCIYMYLHADFSTFCSNYMKWLYSSPMQLPSLSIFSTYMPLGAKCTFMFYVRIILSKSYTIGSWKAWHLRNLYHSYFRKCNYSFRVAWISNNWVVWVLYTSTTVASWVFEFYIQVQL